MPIWQIMFTWYLRFRGGIWQTGKFFKPPLCTVAQFCVVFLPWLACERTPILCSYTTIWNFFSNFRELTSFTSPVWLLWSQSQRPMSEMLLWLVEATSVACRRKNSRWQMSNKLEVSKKPMDVHHVQRIFVVSMSYASVASSSPILSRSMND